MKQTTIKTPVSCYGIGVHSGRTVQLTLKPASVDTGLVFIRSDVSKFENYIFLKFDKVTETMLSTTISNQHGVSVSTIEHLVAAIYGSGIDNLVIEVDGPEVPIMDGSSQPFLFMIDCAGVKYLNKSKKYLSIKKQVYLENTNGGFINAEPSDNFAIDLSIEFKNNVIGFQKASFSSNIDFRREIASARTFGFVKDLDILREKGLAKGASLDNAIGIDEDVILNHEGLRCENEFAKHKLLDAIGDLAVASTNINARFTCHKTGHALNNELLRKIFSDSSNYEWK